MKRLRFIILTFVTCFVYCLQVCKGDLTTLDLPEVSTISNATGPATATVSKNFRICDTTDNLSNSYCTCNDKVVSCDFTHYVGNTANNTKENNGSGSSNVTNPMDAVENIELELYGYKFPVNASRFCICNTPSNLHIKLTPKFLPIGFRNNFQRFDLFNLTGITHFLGGFHLNFHGDLYVANVSHIPEIQANEFGRGTDDPILNVQDIECCSPIKLNQSHKRPVLFIENSTIDQVQTRGINDDHLWKTIIFKSSIFQYLQHDAIIFDSYKGYNVAILKVKFMNATQEGIVFQNAANVILANNAFHHRTVIHSEFFVSRSSMNNSNVIIFDNKFQNEIIMDLDARKIVSWYNFFDLWDNETFAPIKHTFFSRLVSADASNRSISLKYNQVKESKLPEQTFDFQNDTALMFSDNVLGYCNCTLFMLIKDKVVKPELNWCYTYSGTCSVRLDAAFKHCNVSNVFEDLCKNKEVAVPKLEIYNHDLAENKNEMRINSSFLHNIVEEFHFIFNTSFAAKLKGILGDMDEDGSNHSGESGTHDDEHSGGKGTISPKTKKDEPKRSVTVPVLITLSIIVLIIGGIFVYRNRRRFLNRSGHQELVGSRTEMI